MKAEARDADHGWWPYLGPYAAFLLMVEIGARVPVAVQPWMLAVKPAVPAALMVYFAWRGRYPELRNLSLRPGGILSDVALGLALAVLWVLPFALFEGLPRPDASEGFRADQAGEKLVPLVLGLRLFGFAIVTPFFEELFIRSFVMRYAEAFRTGEDFRLLPLARYTLHSFVVTTVVFTAGHVPWEWVVAVPWVMLTNLWFYRRGSVFSVIVVHGVTNATILVGVIVASPSFPGLNGSLSWLWVFA